MINQIKNVTQEKKINPERQKEIKADKTIKIDSFKQLLDLCNQKKEMKLKYELEKNVNLVNFSKNRMEISFNDNLDKNFIKDLTVKLYEWTKQRWIITLSKIKGEITIKEKEKNRNKMLVDSAKETELYKTVLEKFPDANLISLKEEKDFEK